MVERQHRQGQIVHRILLESGAGPGDMDNVAVREGHDLRVAGRARGEEERGNVVLSNNRRLQPPLSGCGVSIRYPVDGLFGKDFFKGGGNECRAGGHALCHSAVLLGGEVRVKGQDNGADGRDGQVGNAPLGRVAGEKDNDVALAVAVLLQEQGSVFHLPPCPGIGDPLVLEKQAVGMLEADRPAGGIQVLPFVVCRRMSILFHVVRVITVPHGFSLVGPPTTFAMARAHIIKGAVFKVKSAAGLLAGYIQIKRALAGPRLGNSGRSLPLPEFSR